MVDMGIWDKIVSFFDYESSSTQMQGSNLPVDAGEPSSEMSARPYYNDASVYKNLCEVSALYRCVSLISNDVASLPVKAVPHRGSGLTKIAPNSRAANFNRVINGMLDRDTPYVFKRDLVVDLLLYGNCFVYPLRVDKSNPRSRVVDMIRIPAYSVDVQRRGGKATDPREKYYIVETSNDELNISLDKREFKENEIVHIRLMAGRSGRLDEGMPVVPANSPDIAIGRSADARVRAMVEKGNLNQFAMIPDESLDITPEEVNSTLKAVAKRKSEHPIMDDSVMNYVELKTTPQSPDMKVLRDQADERIAQRFGIPAPLIGKHVTQWGSGINELNRLYLRGAIKHVIHNMADAFTHSFVDANIYYVKFDVRELMRGDYAGMADVNSQAAGPNHESVITVNEYRDDLDLPPLDDGDRLIEAKVGTSTSGNGVNTDEDTDED